jgi:predicted lipid-binding transport protein (Tim44 family)
VTRDPVDDITGRLTQRARPEAWRPAAPAAGLGLSLLRTALGVVLIASSLVGAGLPLAAVLALPSALALALTVEWLVRPRRAASSARPASTEQSSTRSYALALAAERAPRARCRNASEENKCKQREQSAGQGLTTASAGQMYEVDSRRPRALGSSHGRRRRRLCQQVKRLRERESNGALRQGVDP